MDLLSYLAGKKAGGGGGGGSKLLCSWDFSSATPLVDTVRGLTLESGGVTFGDSGAVFGSATDYITGIPVLPGLGYIEIDVGAMTIAANGNQRFVTFGGAATSNGIVWHNDNAQWGTYFTAWEDTGETSGSFFANSTVKLVIGQDRSLSIYKNGVLFFQPKRKITQQNTSNADVSLITLGNKSGYSIISTIIEAVRVYLL